MKRAITDERMEDLIDVLYSGDSHPICRVHFLNDDGEWTEMEDITNLSFRQNGNDNRYGIFSLTPPVGTMNVAMDNSEQKYTPGSGTIFEGILTRNRQLRAWEGYRVAELETGNYVFDFSTFFKTYFHTKKTAGKIYNDPAPAGFAPDLTGIDFNPYGGSFYGEAFYDYEGYALSHVLDVTGLGVEVIDRITASSDCNKIDVFVRSSETEDGIESVSFQKAMTTVAGDRTVMMPFLNKRYVQFAFLWRTSVWSSTTNYLSAFSLSYRNGEVLFESGIHFADDPSLPSEKNGYSASFTARDYFKKALEANKISLPEMTDVDIVEVIRQAAKKAGMPYTEESLPDLGKTVSLVGSNAYVDKEIKNIFEEAIGYIFATVSNTYRLGLGQGGVLKLYQKPLTAVVADYVLTYRNDMFGASKTHSSNNLLQRAVVSNKTIQKDPPIQLIDQIILVTGETVLSWVGNHVDLEMDVFYQDSPESVALEVIETTLTGIRVNITRDGGTAVRVRVVVNGCLLTNDAFVGQCIVSINHIVPRKIQGKNQTLQRREGFINAWVNRFIASNAEAQSAAEKMAAEWGNQKYQLSVTVWGLPFMEIGDKNMLFEKNTKSNSIFVCESISRSFSAQGAKYRSTITYTDLGFVFENFIFDRNGLHAGPLDILMDIGYLLDQDRGYEPDDGDTFDNLKPVRFHSVT